MSAVTPVSFDLWFVVTSVDVNTALAAFTTKIVNGLGTTVHGTLLEFAHGLGIGAISESMLGVGDEEVPLVVGECSSRGHLMAIC